MGGRDRTDGHVESLPAMAFFKERVDEVITQRDVRSTEDSAYYLVQLLTRFVCPDGTLADLGPRPRHPLGALLLTAAQEHDSYRRFVLLRDVGDVSLVLAGFFADSLRRRQVGSEYYAHVGGAAYGSAAETCRPSANAQVFEELARKFALFAGVLSEVAHRCALADQSTVQEAWRRTTDDATAASTDEPSDADGGLIGDVSLWRLN